MESSKINMENRETESEELMHKFRQLLGRYRRVCLGLQGEGTFLFTSTLGYAVFPEKTGWGRIQSASDYTMRIVLLTEEDNLRKRLRELVDRICDLPDSDEAKLNIVYNFGFAGIEPGPLVLKFMKEQKQKEKNGGEEK